MASAAMTADSIRIAASSAAIGTASVSAGIHEHPIAPCPIAFAQAATCRLNREERKPTRSDRHHAPNEVVSVRCEVQVRATTAVRRQIHTADPVDQKRIDGLAPKLLVLGDEYLSESKGPSAQCRRRPFVHVWPSDGVVVQNRLDTRDRPSVLSLKVDKVRGQERASHVVMIELHELIASQRGVYLISPRLPEQSARTVRRHNLAQGPDISSQPVATAICASTPVLPVTTTVARPLGRFRCPASRRVELEPFLAQRVGIVLTSIKGNSRPGTNVDATLPILTAPIAR